MERTLVKGIGSIVSLKRKLLVGFAAVLTLALGALAWHLWPAFQAPEHIEVGAKIGEKVPIDLPLRDSSGADVTLAKIAGANGTVLVLVRSADWCPFCKVELNNHAKITGSLRQRGYTLASLSYDQPAVLAEFAAGLEQPFTMLSDPDSKFIDAVGLRDPQYGPGHFAYGVPRARVLVLAPDGTITAKFVSADYRQRPSNDFVLSMIE